MVSLKKIKTACSSHHICFVCLKKASKNNRLSRINFNTVLHGYYQHQLFIKRTSRCCRTHLDESRQLRFDLYNMIPTSIKEHDAQFFEIFNYHRNHETSIFEKFKDLSQLDEKHCLKITGWDKEKFLRFSNFITSINDNSKRTKYQLIALYRYWLSTGSSQKVLASLFGSKTTQVQISNYLSDIRTAIYKDFVPFFLGARKKRSFFIRHSNKMVNKLLKLKHDELAIICDGTYTRLEKSSNNEFQYRCWSVQKTDSLIKPFIICCPDGWIIDCYGPFQASENDASILKYILKIDKDLNDILVPNKTIIFLDRGFRDILTLLKDDYKFDCKIPTCQQLVSKNDKPDSKSRQLSVKQTSDTKIVTKCRFMVEKQIGMLKNNKALDNIRNTEAGHIMIDYRICCSMINFDLKPSCPDGENAEKIASKILIRSQKKENDLEFLLGKHLDTKSICPIKISEIVDFPVLKPYICSCLSGKKVVGCCSHVGALIYYLGYAKYRELNFPAERLNKIFVDMENNESPNKPRYFRNKRRKLKDSSSESDSDSESESETSTENQDKKDKSKLKATSSSSKPITYVEQKEKNHEHEELEESTPKLEGKKRKNHSESESKDKNSIPIPEKNNNNKITPIKDNLQEFIKHIPKWSAMINYKNMNDIYLRDTCTVDYHLLGLWFYLRKINHEFLFYEASEEDFEKSLEEIMLKIDNNDWDLAREFLIKNIIKYDVSPTKRGKKFQISLFGSEFEFFIQFFLKYQKHELLQSCDQFCSKNNKEIISKDSEHIYFKKKGENIILYSCYTEKCKECRKKIEPKIKFLNKTNFIYIQSLKNDIFIKELPKEIKIENQTFKFFYSTVNKPGHFLGIFDFEKNLFAVDDISQRVNCLTPKTQSYFRLPTSISFYFLIGNKII
ncbi:unnamed protein product [Brachionus calyciflorus]|uniref:SWIM-type domain-containing protein n=1 Tax=Brachionus calyciflorus TaxID=104777 RepID=A0A814BBN5_9BILA|nr:unnamed protein product [Brachionus calyciflorus]